MASDTVQIFSNPYKTQETWAAQGAVVNWSVGSGTTSANQSVPLLMQQISINYQRSIQTFYPLNQTRGALKRCVISGPAKGQLTVQGIYAPTSGTMGTFLDAVGKACKTDSDQVTMTIHPFGTASCSNSTTKYNDQKWILTGVELEALQLGIQGGEAAMVSLPLTFSFANLSIAGLTSDMDTE